MSLAPLKSGFFHFMLHSGCNFDAAGSFEEIPVRTSVTIDDALYERALQVADPAIEKAELFREVFRTFVRVQSAKRPVALGEAAPEMADVVRRREEPAK